MFTGSSRYRLLGGACLAGLLAVFGTATVQADLFVASETSNTILQYDESSATLIANFANSLTPDPRGILWGPDGNLYVASNGQKQIYQFDNMGNGPLPFVQPPAGGLNGPRGIIFGADGNLYVSCKNSNKVERYDGTTGAYIDDFVTSGSGNLSGPRGLVFGPDGNLYVGSFGDVGPTNAVGVLVFDGKSGSFLSQFNQGDPSPLSGINGLCFGPDGNLYVSNANAGAIRRYDPSGNYINDFVANGPSNGGLSDPNGVLFGGDGNLYVGDDVNGGILQYDPSGNFLQYFVYSSLDCPPAGHTSYLTFTKTNPVTLNYGQ